MKNNRDPPGILAPLGRAALMFGFVMFWVISPSMGQPLDDLIALVVGAVMAPNLLALMWETAAWKNGRKPDVQVVEC